MVEQFRKLNNITGWFVFIIASAVYILTKEPTASFWDCGEYIACCYKLEVGHPPGAPTFMLVGKLFTLLSSGNVKLVPEMVNIMSNLASGFTILFLFWSITALAKKIAFKNNEITNEKIFIVLGSGLVGALAYTFSDSFWFSAVEGEVYASSSFYTAIVFWAMLKWEQVADEKGADRWLVLIAYLIGLSVGVHLLNLLTIPALAYIYYFKKYKPTTKGLIITGILSIVLLGLVQSVIIPQVVNLFAKVEILFVNAFHLPFNSGTIFFAILLIGLIIWGLNYTKKKNKVNLNTIILSFAFLLIGYSTFLVLIIRSNADTPMDENNPDNAVNLLSYLNREQYGETPVSYGPYFVFSKDENNNDFQPPYDQDKPFKDGSPVYGKDEKLGKYVVIDDRKNSIPNYAPEFCTFFPRMWNFEKDHVEEYKKWGNVKGVPVQITDNSGDHTVYKPTFINNLTYFFNYQIGWMYFRYFMWNFAGKQNDIQGHGDPTNGNWISGISLIDDARLGDQNNLPPELKNNRGKNKFYMLPFLLGIIGLFYHYNKNKKDMFIVSLLFLLTGLAIILYLNQYPLQPRERDYAYVGSFYAFAIWIGLGAMAIYDFLSEKIKVNKTIIATATTTACLLLVPTIMAKEGWNDHDRSNRFTVIDWASNYLNSCDKNAIIFTNGDNDTFPLWYAQEVEGVRTDVRVCNLSLLNTGWYIDQMKRKAYNSDPVPFSLTEEKYRESNREYIYIIENKSLQGYTNLKDLIDFVASDDPSTKYPAQSRQLDYFPTRKFYIPVDINNVIKTNTVSKDKIKDILPAIEWTYNERGIMKSQLMVLDLLANFNWKRPIYFAITTGHESYIDLEKYFQLEGLAYRFIPIKDTANEGGQSGVVNTEIMYNNVMNKFKWGNMNNPKVYLDETNRRMIMNFRSNFTRLAETLIKEGSKDSALAVLKRCEEVTPENCAPYDYFMSPIGELYYQIGKNDKGNSIIKKVADYYDGYLKYYFSLKPIDAKYIEDDKQRALSVMNRLASIAKMYKQDKLAKEIETVFSKYYSQYQQNTSK
ncbi:MAG: DUF2723 domain-containing protein [Bacteroidales bacterium]|jgi:hypothetical protein